VARDSFHVSALPGGATLFHNAQLSFRCDHAQRIFVVVRTAVPFQRVEEIEATTAALARIFPTERRAGFSILSDFREGPVRVHPALEPAFTRYREESQRGFVRCAVIVATPVGRARGARLREQEHSSQLLVTESVEDALAFVRPNPKPGA